MLLLKRNAFEVSSDSPLVKEDAVAVVAKAEEIVNAAEAEASRIAEDAKSAYEVERKRGYEDGIAEGRKQILAQKLEMLDESIAYMERIEGALSDIVVKALRKFVCDIGDRELVVQIVKKSLDAIIRNQSVVTLRVAPEMVVTVKERLGEILAEFPSVLRADVKENPRLKGAACVVETEVGSVEASVDGQLEAIEKSLAKSFGRRNGGGAA